MATSAWAKFILLFFFFTTDARLLGFREYIITSVPKDNINGNQTVLFRKIGFSPSVLEYYKRRALSGALDRAAPGGPDPHHNP